MDVSRIAMAVAMGLFLNHAVLSGVACGAPQDTPDSASKTIEVGSDPVEQAEFADSVGAQIEAMADSAKALLDSTEAHDPTRPVVYTDAEITQNLEGTGPFGVHRVVAVGAQGTLLIGTIQFVLESADYRWLSGGVVAVPVRPGEVTQEPDEDPVCRGSCASLWVFTAKELEGMPLDQMKEAALENPVLLPDRVKDRLKIRTVPRPITSVVSSTPGGRPTDIRIGSSDGEPDVLLVLTP